MRITTTLSGVAAAALVAGAVLDPSQPPAVASSDEDVRAVASGEYRGELYPNPETGCIELPDEPGAEPRISPAEELPRSDVEEVRPGGTPERTEGPWEFGENLDLYAQPWPLCDRPEVSVVVTEDEMEIVDAPDEPDR